MTLYLIVRVCIYACFTPTYITIVPVLVGHAVPHVCRVQEVGNAYIHSYHPTIIMHIYGMLIPCECNNLIVT